MADMRKERRISQDTPPFVVVEGVDGAGKSSHLAALAATLADQGWSVVTTREPGGTDLAEACRALLLNHAGGMDAVTETLLALAARRDHVRRVIVPALQDGRAVLCDRFNDSTWAYQMSQIPDTDRLALHQAEDLARASRRPDLVLLFDVPAAVSRARLAATSKTPDRFEGRDQAYFEAVRAAYHARVAADPDRYAVIDATQPLPAVRVAACQAIVRRFTAPPKVRPRRPREHP